MMAMRAQPIASAPRALGKFVKTPSKHKSETPEPGDLVRIHYVGMLEDGSVFDSSRARGEPFQFNLGESQVIDGWDVLIRTMALGERADLVIPPEYAYGEAGIPPVIPPNATLTFDVEVLDIGRPVEGSKDAERPEGAQEDDGRSDETRASRGLEVGGRELFWEKDPERESGGGPGYVWKATGTGAEICISVPLADNVKVKDINVDVRTHWISCTVGSDLIFEGELFAAVDSDDSHWDLERSDNSMQLLVYLVKIDTALKWAALFAVTDAEGVEFLDTEVVDVDEALRIANRQSARSTSAG